MYRQTYLKRNKYNAVRTSYNGYNYPSKLEASQAAELDLLLKAKRIKAWDRQFKVEIYAKTLQGDKVHVCDHKIDFRVYELDGSYTLIEAKGVETSDYKWRRKMLELFWLPEHLDHAYQVVK
jgi:hypothetical protein